MTDDERNALCEANLSLVDVFFRRYGHKYGRDDDLYQIACIALLEACATYDQSKGSLEAYAHKAMRHDVLDELAKRKRYSVEVPYSDRAGDDGEDYVISAVDAESVLRRVREQSPRTAEMLKMRLEGATLAEIGEAYNLTHERIRQILSKAREML
jgi:RNA polymerase sigma factor (sigma-70 family)